MLEKLDEVGVPVKAAKKLFKARPELMLHNKEELQDKFR